MPSFTRYGANAFVRDDLCLFQNKSDRYLGTVVSNPFAAAAPEVQSSLTLDINGERSTQDKREKWSMISEV